MSAHLKENLLAVCTYSLKAGLLICLLSGCATSPSPLNTIATGDAVSLDYTCRIEGGSILATTRKSEAYEETTKLSHAFVVSKEYRPVYLNVGGEIQPPEKPVVRTLTDEIAFRLVQQIEGVSYDDTHQLAVTSEAIAGLPEMERFLQYSRTMRRPKQRSIPKEQFVANTGKEPVIGEVLFADQAMPWKVVGVGADSVEIQYFLQEGQKLMMPFGEAVVHDRGEHYELEIETRPGGLVRVGPYIGRIVDINDQLFIVDFEHPFGGRELACEVTVHRENGNIDQVMDSAAPSDENKTVSE